MNADSVVEILRNKVKECGLTLLDHYPADLETHDRKTIEMFLLNGFSVAWCVGNYHTHCFPLGIHPEDNLCVTYVTQLSGSDCYFALRYDKKAEKLSVIAKSREQFNALQSTPVAFKRVGQADSFLLTRGNRELAQVNLRRKHSGTYGYNATIVRVDSKPNEVPVIERWAFRSAVELGHTLFMGIDVTWKERVRVAMC